MSIFTRVTASVTGLLLAGSLVAAQQPAPTMVAGPPGSGNYGTITGRVVCNDTQRPARFAQVMLTPVGEANGGDDDRGGRRGGARTDLDGVYTATNVAEGDYYVSASATGYISEQSMLQAGLRAGTDLQTLLSRLPVVHVSAGGSTTANVTLERGATIAGKILWDDGGPAAGVSVSAVPPASTTTVQTRLPGNGGFGGASGGFAQTDDRGQYRLTGLVPGDYLVRVNMPIPASGNGRGGYGGGSVVAVYAPGKIRMTDAKPLTVRAAEERDDVLVTLDLRALHTVSGRVSSASDSMALGSGSIRITDQQDTTLTRAASLAADGSFTLPYVPSGTYTLSVPYASTSSTSYGGRGGRGSASGTSFQPLTQTITVTDSDVSGLAISLAPAPVSSQSGSQSGSPTATP